jgi:hypothetical protein
VIRVGEFVFADSEFSHLEGERPVRSSCFVAHEERSRRTIRAVRPGIGCRIPKGVVEYGSEPPWAHEPADLFSAFSVGAEMGSAASDETTPAGTESAWQIVALDDTSCRYQ